MRKKNLNPLIPNFTTITKRQMLSMANKKLGNRFTLREVSEVYRAIEATIKELLEGAGTSVKLFTGLTLISGIKEGRTINLYGKRKINVEDKLWIKADVSTSFNNKLDKEYRDHFFN